MLNWVEYLSYTQASEKLCTLDRLLKTTQNDITNLNSAYDEIYATDLSMVMYDDVTLDQLDVAINKFDLQNISFDDFVNAESMVNCLRAIGNTQMPRNI